MSDGFEPNGERPSQRHLRRASLESKPLTLNGVSMSRQTRESALDRDEKRNGKLTDNLKPAEMRAFRKHLLPVLLKSCGVANGELEQAVPSMQEAAGEAGAGPRLPLSVRLGLARECNDPNCGCHGSHVKWPHGEPETQAVNWERIWLLIFVGMLLVDLVCHLFGKTTLTRSITSLVPWWLGMGFFTWAWVHFAVWYWRQR